MSRRACAAVSGEAANPGVQCVPAPTLDRYAVIVRWPHGSRAYIVHAEDREDLMRKLTSTVDLAAVDTITIAEVLLPTDEF